MRLPSANKHKLISNIHFKIYMIIQMYFESTPLNIFPCFPRLKGKSHFSEILHMTKILSSHHLEEGPMSSSGFGH